MRSSLQARKNYEGLFLFVMGRSGGRCWYCGKKIWSKKTPYERAGVTIDHLIPISLNGTDYLDNLVPCCSPCNGSKHARVMEDFRRVFAQRALGMPVFSFEQIEWVRARGVDLTDYDNFKFWFETRKTRAQCSSGSSERLPGTDEERNRLEKATL